MRSTVKLILCNRESLPGFLFLFSTLLLIMKNFYGWKIRVKKLPEKNYTGIWCNNKTWRLKNQPEKPILELPPFMSEFYDVGLGTFCSLECPFCYTAAGKNGEHWLNPVGAWKSYISNLEPDKEGRLDYKEITGTTGEDSILRTLLAMYPRVIETQKPFQIAIGSTCEPTEHPDFCKFLESVYESKVVPNYTTNGIKLSDEILEATRNFVGGVAVSLSNRGAEDRARKSISLLLEKGECKVNIHHIISGKESVDKFIQVWSEYGNDINYHVLLPLMNEGRSVHKMDDSAFYYLEEKIEALGIKNIAFGANFLKQLRTSKLKIWEYPQETYSKNMLLKNDRIEITSSSFDLTPIESLCRKF